MLPAVGAAAHDQFGKAATFESAQALADLTLRKVHHRFTAGFLIAGNDQRIERQRIGFRAGGLLLDQRTQNADFRAVEPWLVERGFLLTHDAASLPDS
ncbi:hypothetical protein D3C73_1439020 [compost metagenome]